MESRFEDTLKCVHSNKSLDMAAVHVQVLLRMNRLDLAMRELAVMQSMSDDATLTILAGAWCNVFRGGEYVDEAFRTFEDLRERFGQTPVILNGLAACHMAREEFVRAEELLQLVLQVSMLLSVELNGPGYGTHRAFLYRFGIFVIEQHE